MRTSRVLLCRACAPEGCDIEDARSVGLRGKSDDEILAYGTDQLRTILTADVGFANILRFPLGSHHGIIVIRFPNEVSVNALNESVAVALRSIEAGDVEGNLIVVEPGRVRLRRL